MKRKPTPELPDLITAVQLAELSSLSERRVQQMIAEGIIPKDSEEGRYPFRAAIGALISHYRDQATGQSAEKARDQARREKAQADSAEMQAGRDSGMLMLTADAKRMWSDGFVKLRDVVVRSSLTAAQKKELTDKMQKITLTEL
jgi:phage terminase Nu1 subunit (DNA packaging protein)